MSTSQADGVGEAGRWGTAPQNDHVAVRFFWVGLVLLTALRGLFNGSFPLTGEEAYYWAWSRQLEFGYFDHPPMVAWLIRAATELLGHSVFAARSAPLFAHTVAAAVVYSCARRVTGDSVIAAWAGLSFALTIFFAAMATLSIPDGVLFLFWSCTMWLVIEAIQPGRAALWPLAGLALGLTGLSKFHGVLLAATIGVFVLVSPRQRPLIRSPWFALAVVIAGLTVAPVLLWNAAEGWPTLTYQLVSRHEASGGPIYLLEMLCVPFGYVGPLLYPLVAFACWRALREGFSEGRDDLIFLGLACAVPFLAFLIPSAFMHIDAQWAAPAFVSGVVLAAREGVRWSRDAALRPRWRLALGAATALNAALLAIAMVGVLAVYHFPNLVPRSDEPVLAHRKRIRTSKISRFYGWAEIGQRLAEEVDTLGGPDRAFIYARVGYATATALQFYAGGKARTYNFDTPPEDGHQFVIWERRADPTGLNAIFVAQKKRHLILDFLREHFERIERLDDVVIERGGREQQRFFLVRCWNLRRKPNAEAYAWPPAPASGPSRADTDAP